MKTVSEIQKLAPHILTLLALIPPELKFVIEMIVQGPSLALCL